MFEHSPALMNYHSIETAQRSSSDTLLNNFSGIRLCYSSRRLVHSSMYDEAPIQLSREHHSLNSFRSPVRLFSTCIIFSTHVIQAKILHIRLVSLVVRTAKYSLNRHHIHRAFNGLFRCHLCCSPQACYIQTGTKAEQASAANTGRQERGCHSDSRCRR